MKPAGFFPPSNEARGIVLMLVSVALFSATSLLLGYMNHRHGVNGWVASAYRAAIGLAVVTLMQGRTGKLSLHRIVTRPLLFTRGLIGGLTIPVFYITIMELGPGRAGMIMGSYPVFGALFASLFIGESVSRRYFVYIGIALLGLAGIFADTGIGPAQPVFDAIALFGAAAGGLCVVLIRHLRHTETTSNIFAAQCVFALGLGLGVAGGDVLIRDPVVLGWVLLASVTVAAAQLCITEAFRHLNVAKGSTLQMLTPACTALASAALLDESFSLFEVLGGAAILFAGVQIVKERSQPPSLAPVR